MTTEAQVAANRLNAQKSTGPRTPEGKAAVALNAVTHGLRGQTVVLPGEDRDEWSRYRASMVAELHPEGREEVDLAERIVGLSWRLRRAARYDGAVFDALYEQQAAQMAQEDPSEALEPYTGNQVLGRMLVADFSGPRVLERVQLYEGRIERSLFRARDEWDRLRAQPRLADQRQSLPFQGRRDIPAVSTPDGVTTNRSCQTKPTGAQAAAGNGLGCTNKANREGPTAGKQVPRNKQSQFLPPTLGGWDAISAKRAAFRDSLGLAPGLTMPELMPRLFKT